MIQFYQRPSVPRIINWRVENDYLLSWMICRVGFPWISMNRYRFGEVDCEHIFALLHPIVLEYSLYLFFCEHLVRCPPCLPEPLLSANMYLYASVETTRHQNFLFLEISYSKKNLGNKITLFKLIHLAKHLLSVEVLFPIGGSKLVSCWNNSVPTFNNEVVRRSRYTKKKIEGRIHISSIQIHHCWKTLYL